MKTPEVRLICSVTVRRVVGNLLRIFGSSHEVAIQADFQLVQDLVQSIKAGEAFDVGITRTEYIPDLVAAGRVDASSHAPFGRIPLAIARRSGAPGVVLTSVEDVRALMRQAKAIAYSADAGGAPTFLDLLGRMRIADKVGPRARPMASGQPMTAVAQGRVEFAVAPLTSIIALPGIEVAALLPSSLQADISLSMFLSAGTAPDSLARALVTFLGDTGLDAYLAANGVFRYRLP